MIAFQHRRALASCALNAWRSGPGFLSNTLAKSKSASLLAVGLLCYAGASAQVSVSPSGTPGYSQPISVPPGVAGLAPKLSLSYAGVGANGSVGYGWSVQGISSITRCPATIAVDNSRRVGINFAADDKLCLDGQRLVQVNASGAPVVGIGTNDAAGLAASAYREYRTGIDSYSRIRAYGYANGDATGASGPAFFKVWTKAGQILEYGDSPSADTNTKALINVQGKTVAMVWAVSRISDVPGNHLDFKYEQRDYAWGSGPTAGSSAPGHEWNLLEVHYSGNKVVFTYDPLDQRVDKSEAYNQGAKNVSARLLKSITTYINSPNTSALGPAADAVAVKTVKLTHDNGPVTNRSRVSRIQECAGNASSTRCLPATTIAYRSGGTDAYVASTAFNQSSLVMQSTDGSYGVIVGDFSGDGKTDFIRWSGSDASQNQLWLSNGDGSFTQSSGFNLNTQLLFSQSGCHLSAAVDIDGDGLPDLVRHSGPTSPTGATCASPGPVLFFRNNGDGSFTQLTYSGPALNRDSSADYYLADFDGDGKADLITAGAGYMKYVGLPDRTYTNPPYQFTCVDASGTCTRVFRGSGSGSFIEVATNVGGTPIYNPSTLAGATFNSPRRIIDAEGDGLWDLTSIFDGDSRKVIAPGLRSRGDGNFDVLGISTSGCSHPIDFNGDRRTDCLAATSTTAYNRLYVGTSGNAASFNLTAAGQELAGAGVGFVVADVNGDDRQDIIRWKDDPAQNLLYLSNGDGTFTASTTFTFAGVELKKSDGTANFLIGDFTGLGNVEILRMKTVGGVASNQLYVKQDSTPPDQLMSVTSGTGATTSFIQVPLSNPVPAVGSPSASLGPRYVSDRGTSNAAALPIIDITVPMYVVATTINDSGVGTNKVNTEYGYFGLKADTLGRGLLGFREIRRQTPGANGNPLTTATQFLQIAPYIGEAAIAATYNAALNAVSAATRLDQTVNIYCDHAAAAGSDTTALTSKVSCPSTAKLQKPYLLLSTSTGNDLSGVVLPTVTTQSSVNATGDPLQVAVTTTGSVAGVNQTFSKTTTNTYYPDNVGCAADNLTCGWIIGRIQRAVVSSSVPNSLSSIGTSAGSGAYANATQGVAPAAAATLSAISFSSRTVGSASSLTSTLSNTGPVDLAITVPSSSSVTGAGFSFASTTCASSLAPGGTCSVTVAYAPTTAAAHGGNLSVSTSAGTKTANLSGTGVAPSVVYQPQSTAWGTVGVASDSGDWPTIKNNSDVSVRITAHSSVSGPNGTWSWQGQSGYCQPGATVLAPGASCQTFFGMGGAATVGTYTAVDQITYEAQGASGTTFNTQQSYTFSLGTTTSNPTSLSFGDVAYTGSSTKTFTLTNDAVNGGSLKALSISLAGTNADRFSVNHNCGTALAQGASCTVTVGFTPGSVTNGFSASVQVQGSYSRMQAGADSGYTPTTTGVTLNVPVSGNGFGAAPTLTSAASQAAPAAWYGAAARTVTLTYRNDGNQAMSLGNPALSAPLSLSSNACTGIANGASCHIVISVASNVAGINQSQVVTPSSNGYGASGTVVTWTNYTAVPRWGSASLDFGSVTLNTASTRNITLYNDGNTAYTWSGAGIGNLPAGFAFNLSNCSNVAPNGGSCLVAVTFTPAAAQGYGGTNLFVSGHSYVGASFYLSVSGAGVAAPSITSRVFTPASVSPGATSTFSWATSNATSASVACSAPASGSGSGTSGNITVSTSGTGAGTCTVTAVNAAGASAQASASLTVSSAAVFTVTGPASNVWTFRNPNSFAVTPTAVGTTGTNAYSAFASINTSGTTCKVSTAVAPGGTCTVHITAMSPDCTASNYSVRPFVTTAAGTTYGAYLNKSANSSSICQ